VKRGSFIRLDFGEKRVISALFFPRNVKAYFGKKRLYKIVNCFYEKSIFNFLKFILCNYSAEGRICRKIINIMNIIIS